MARKILIVDDNADNRMQLRQALHDGYDILEADSSGAAMQLLRRQYKFISVIVLDIALPGSDGYDLLRAARDDIRLRTLPVIVVTALHDSEAEARAISLGAYGFLSKPYNPSLLLYHLRNAITLRENAAIVNSSRRDKLTRLYNLYGFTEQAEQLLKAHEPGYYAISGLDIDHFKIINDQYGVAVGDCVLRYVADTIHRCIESIGGICCRVGADDFAMLYPASQIGSEEILRSHRLVMSPDCIDGAIKIRVGRYIIDDLSLNVNAMYDRAVLARESIKGRYDVYAAQYSDAMRDRLLREQKLVGQMENALAQECFEVWLQPQYNHATGAIIGAEALVRWRETPGGRLIQPAAFIPAFERNGFIYKLDKFVWEQACRLLRRWLDAGHDPLPLSVNVSRFDLLQADIVGTLLDLVQKYALPKGLLRLEITESAFADSTEQIVRVAAELIERGFTVEIDDFGTGYSSLNTLKEVPAQVLKLDMRFFSSSGDSNRGGNIIESVVRMAKWLGMVVIAEGVETPQQAEYLKSIGSYYVQGYLYARPMPVEEYEALAGSTGKEERLITLKTVENLDNNAFWNPESMDTLIFNSYVGAACIFEYLAGSIELLRFSAEFGRQIRSRRLLSRMLKLNWADYLDEEGRAQLREVLDRSIRLREEAARELIFRGLPGCTKELYIHARLRVIATAGQHLLVYCTVENMTAQRRAERKAAEAAAEIQAMMRDIPGAFARLRIEADGKPTVLFVNETLCRMCGRKYKALLGKADAVDDLHADELSTLREILRHMLETGEKTRMTLRLRRADGSTLPLNAYGSVSRDDEGFRFLNVYFTELSDRERRDYTLRETTPLILAAIMKSSPNLDFAKDKDFRYLCCSPAFARLVGQSGEQDVIGKTDFDLFSPETAEQYRRDDVRLFGSGESLVEYTEAIPSSDSIQHYSVTSKYALRDSTGAVIGLYGTGRDVTDVRSAYDQLKLLTDSIPGGLAQYAVSADDMKITYFNEGFLRLLGYTHEEYDALAKTSIVSRVYPDDLPDLMAQAKALYEHGTPVNCTYRTRGKSDRGCIWVNLRGELAQRDDGVCYVNAVLYDVTAQREAQRQERLHAQQLRAIMENAGSGIRAMIMDGDKVEYLFSNDRFYEIQGYTREMYESQVADAYSVIHPDDRPWVKEEMSAATKAGDFKKLEFRTVTPKGDITWVRAAITVTDFEGVDKPVQLCVYSDITAEKQKAEQEAQLLDNLPSGAALFEYDGQVLSLVHLNRRYFELVGREAADAAFMDAVQASDRERVLQELTDAIRDGRDISCNIHVRDGGGGYRPFHVAGRIIARRSDKYSIFASYTPIDPDAISYQELLPQILSAVMKSSNAFAYAKNRELRMLGCSPAFLQMAGLDDESEAIGKTDFDLFPPEVAAQFRKNDIALLKGGTPMIDFDELVPARDGTPRHFQTSKYILNDASGEPMGIYGISRDITDIKKMRSTLEFVTDNIPGGLISFRYAKGSIRISYCNDGFCTLFGGTRAGLASRGDLDPLKWIFKTDQPIFYEQLAQMEANGTPSDCTFRIHTLGTGSKWVNYKAVAAENRSDDLIVNAILLDVTSEQTVLEQLRISEEENNLAILQGERVVCRYSIADRTLTMAASLAKTYGLPDTIADVPEGQVRAGLISPETSRAYLRFFEDILAGGKEGKVLYQQKYFGSWQWVEAKSSTIYADDGTPIRAIISMLDVTKRLEQEALYQRWQQSLENRSEGSYSLYRCNLNNDFSYDTKTGTLITFDFENAGKTFSERFCAYAEQLVYPDDRAAFLDFFCVEKMTASYYRGNRSAKLEYRELLPDGGFRWLRVTVDLVENAAFTAVEAYLMYEDIDRKKRKELQTKKRSETDPLTGLLNRTTFSEKADRHLRAMKPGVRHAMMILDLDGFKQVNDVLGHAVGDQALIDIAKDLSAALRAEDFAARLGGDEFVIFLCGIRDDGTALETATQICALARKSLGAEVKLSGSVGIAVAPRDGDSFAALYRKMDAALYYVKGSGKDNIAVYNDAMADEHPQPEHDAPRDFRKKDKKRRILTVDDSPIDLTLMEQVLKDEYLVEKAKSGPEALIRLRYFGTAVSAVLLDLSMPGMDGFEVLEQMHGNATLRPIPVLVVSGDESRDTCLKAIRKGATDYITKPIDAELLRIRVQSAISKAENERLRAQNSLLEAQSEERIRYDYVLERAGSTFIEYNWMTGDFLYYPSISNYLAGKFDERRFWQILLSDFVTDTQTVKRMQQLVHRISEARERKGGSLIVKLKTPKRVYHSFRMNVHKITNDFGLTNKLIITLTDLDYEAT